MELLVLGSGSIFSTSLSASYLINRQLLLDCPNGIVKQMKRLNVDIGAIDHIYISHFHADHYFDLPFLLLEMGLFAPRKTPLNIYGPATIEATVKALFELAYPDVADAVLANCNIQYHDIADRPPSHLANHPCELALMHHDATTVYGLMLGQPSQRVGFTFDSTYGPSVELMAKKCQLLLFDLSSMDTNPFHMGLDSIAKIQAVNPNLRLIATHISDDVRQRIPATIEAARDGWTINL